MIVLILSDSPDVHAEHVKAALIQAEIEAYYFDTSRFPTQLQLSWQPHSQSGSLKLTDGHQLAINEIHSVFWRNFTGVYVPALKDADQHMIASQDSMSALRSFMQACPARWVNSWQAYQFHKEKPLQLHQVHQLGVAIPRTLISNDPDEITAFAHAQEKAIFKPVYGGSHTKLLTEDWLDSKRLSLALRLAPITIQEYIPGTNIRSYVIGNAVYAAEIRSGCLDFREDDSAELIPIELPESVEKQCIAIAQSLKLEWTAIDWRRKPMGEYVFLEANPSPMFIYFEQQTGFPITQTLIQRLIQ